MRVAVGSDHAGFDLKEILRAELTALDHDVADAGTHEAGVSVDCPAFGAAVGRVVAGGDAELGRHDAGIAKLAELDRELVHQTTPEGNP